MLNGVGDWNEAMEWWTEGYDCIIRRGVEFLCSEGFLFCVRKLINGVQLVVPSYTLISSLNGSHYWKQNYCYFSTEE